MPNAAPAILDVVDVSGPIASIAKQWPPEKIREMHHCAC